VRALGAIELRAIGARGADSKAVEGLGIGRFAAAVGILGANFEGLRLGLLEASVTVAEVFFPGERLRTTA
jgi:hypothetical protein